MRPPHRSGFADRAHLPQAGRDVPRQRLEIEPIRVVLLSDQHLVRETVRVALLSRGFEVLGIPFPVGPTAVRDIAQVVLKIRGVCGLILAELGDQTQRRDILALMDAARIRWLLLTRGDIDAHAGAAIESGAVGVLPMTSTLDELTGALQALADGRIVMDPDLRARVLAEWREVGQHQMDLASKVGALTPRELSVLASLNNGFTVKEIALSHKVSEGTVRSQVKSILRKLDVNSQIAGVAAYRQVTEQSLPPTRPSTSSRR